MGQLEGIKVIELAKLHAGPKCGDAVADMAPDVSKGKPPGGRMTHEASSANLDQGRVRGVHV